MGILLKEIRIRNYRSLKCVDVLLDDNNILIGANNAGKTSLLQAIQLAFSGRRISSDDIHIEKNETLPFNRQIIIDVLIVPTDSDYNEIDSFDDIWIQHFGNLLGIDKEGKFFFAMRTNVYYDKLQNSYKIERRALKDWPNSEDMLNYTEYLSGSISEKILQALPVFYLDSKRDIVSDMKDKSSYWARMISDINLKEDEIIRIEKILDEVNNDIINQSQVLKHLSLNLKRISETVNAGNESIIINPVLRKIRDLNRSIDISFQDKDSEAFPVLNHGMGTRSWLTFLTLVAYVTWLVEQTSKDYIPFHPIVLLEEPEAHLHPQAQRHIFKQMSKMVGQKVISSHSPFIVAQANLQDIIHLYKKNGCAKVSYIDTSNLTYEEIRKLRKEVISSRGELLFSQILILCEGETEEQALPVFFKKYFGCDCFEVGVSIIAVKGYGNYKPFLQVAKNLNIDYFIFSDGEYSTINKIKNDIYSIFGNDKSFNEYENIFILDNNNNFEKYLIEEGYKEELIEAINTSLGANYFENYKNNKNGSKYSRKDKRIRNYNGNNGEVKALLDCLSDNKLSYSSVIADIISEKGNKIPSKIEDLFNSVNNILKIRKNEKRG